jgi:hypothetical protein
MEWIHQETGIELCPSLPAHLHYGAPTSAAVTLMLGGIRSRRLSVAIGERAAAELVSDENLRAWLSQMGLSKWRSEFKAAPAELADLLQFVRNPAANIGHPLLDGKSVQLPCSFDEDIELGSEFSIEYLSTEEPPRSLVAINQAGIAKGQLHPSEYHDVSMLVDAGFQVFGNIVDSQGERMLELRLNIE